GARDDRSRRARRWRPPASPTRASRRALRRPRAPRAGGRRGRRCLRSSWRQTVLAGMRTPAGDSGTEFDETVPSGLTLCAVGSVLRSKLDTRSDAYRENLAQMRALWDQVADLMAQVPTIGGQRYVDRHHQRGKMLARE